MATTTSQPPTVDTKAATPTTRDAVPPTPGAPADQPTTGLTTRAVFETCLKNGDLGPIVQLYFDLRHGTAAAQLHFLDDRALQEAATDDRPERAVRVLLQQIADAQADDVAAVCRANAEEVARTLAEISAMQSASAQLRNQFVANNDLLQSVGTGLLSSLQQWQKINTTQAALLSVQTSVQVAAHLSRYLSRAGHDLLEGRLYQGFTVLQRMRRDPLYAVLDTSSSKRDASAQVYQQQLLAVAPEARAQLAQGVLPPGLGLGRVGKWVVKRRRELLDSMQSMALEQFTQWLVKARAQQQDVGMRAIRRAAGERQLHALLEAQRVDLAARLVPQGGATGGAGALDDLAALVVQARQELVATKRGDAAALDAAWKLLEASRSQLVLLPQEQEATSTGRAPLPHKGSFTLQKRVSEADTPLMEGLDMTTLSRCVHIHKCLGKLSTVREQYATQRGLQLKADLDPPADFLGSYQTYIAQIVGFFVIEERVGRLGHEGIGAQADVGWSRAVQRLTALLEGSFDAATSADTVLVVKDFMQLAITALALYSYPTVMLENTLARARARYVELLMSTTASQANLATTRDSLQPVTLADKAAVDHAVRDMGLPACMEHQQPPTAHTLPMQMPYSAMVPDLLVLAQRFIMDSARYLTGLVTRGEVLPAVRQSRDVMLRSVLAEAFDRRVQREIKNATWGFEQCCMMVNNSLALRAGVARLERYTCINLAMSVPGSARAAEGTHLSAVLLERFDELRSAAEDLVAHVVNTRLLGILRSMKNEPWLPDKPSFNAQESAYISALILEMRHTMGAAATLLPRNSYCRLAQDVFAYLNAALLSSLATTQQIAGFNVFAVQRLFNDCGHLQNFASSLQVPGLVEVLPKPLAFCDVLLHGRVEELSKGSKREAMGFEQADLKMLVQLLDKYCDAKPPPGSKIPESFVKRKATEVVAKELRLQAGMKPKYVEESAGTSGADELRDITHVTDSFKKQIGLM